MKVLKKDDKDSLKAVVSCLDEEIKEEDEKLEKLRGLRDRINKKLWEQRFSCPLEKNDYFAICPECPEALPEVNQGSSVKGSSLWFRLPPGMSEELKEKCEKNRVGCEEWRRKVIMPTCGCGGTFTCKCGYEDGFCMFLGGEKICPFCGRKVRIDHSGIASTMDISEIIKEEK